MHELLGGMSMKSIRDTRHICEGMHAGFAANHLLGCCPERKGRNSYMI